jgi:tetratricopeptide (TPR) repeat protein
MVLDNVDDDDVFFRVDEDVGRDAGESKRIDLQQPLEAFLPQSPNGFILVTSRNSTAARNLIGNYGSVIDVEPMTESEALALLETRVFLDEASRGDARELVQVLEGIPLAITHAASYIRNRQRITISVYVKLFRESEANRASLLNNGDAKDLRRDHSIRHPVITTWQITFEQIRRTAPAATDLLALMSMFDRQGIPECLLHHGADRLQFEDAIAPLLNFSLIRERTEMGSFEMHRLVQLSTRKWLEVNKELQRWIKEALRTMAKVFPNGQFETWSLCQVLLPHTKEVLAHEQTDEEDVLNRAKVGNDTGWYLLRKGEYGAGEIILRETLEAREKVLGPEHLDTLTSVNSLALVLTRQEKYNEAEQLNRRALEGREKVLGPEHRDTLISVGSLATVLQEYDEAKAELLNRRALEGREKVLGLEHSHTLTSVSNLAWVLQKQGKYDEAEPLNRRALEAREKVLGPEHPDTLTSVNNLAWVLQKQGKYDEAELLNRQALEGMEKELGPEHPHTLTSANNLALVLKEAGEI